MAGMIVEIGGNSKPAVAAITEVTTALKQQQPVLATVQKESAALYSKQPGVGKAVAGIEEVTLTLKEQKAVLASLKREYAALSTADALGAPGKMIAADMKIANMEIARLGGVATNTFGNIGSAATKGFSAVRQFAYILPGIGIAGIIGGLADLVVGLFEGAKGFDAIDIASGHWNNDLKELKNTIDEFKSSLDFKEKLQNLQLELSGVTGPALSSGQSANAMAKNAQLIGEYSSAIDKLTSKNSALREARAAFEQTYVGITGKNTLLAKAIFEFKSIENIPEGVASKLKKADQELVKDYQKVNEEIKSLSKQRQEALQNTIISATGIVTPFIKTKDAPKVKIPKLNVEAESILLLPKRGEIIKGSLDLKYIQLVLMGNLPKSFKEQFEEKINKELQDLVVKPDISGSRFTNTDAFKKMQDHLKGLAALGQEVGSTLASAFGQVFDAVAKGQNAFKALGQAIKQVVLDLIKAAIETAIVSAIMNLFVPGSGSAVKGAGIIGKLLSHHATGGPVGANQPMIVGETGKELFVPSTSGRIVPNNSLGSIQGGANPTVIFNGRLAVSGNELKLLLNRTDRYQGTNV